MPDSNIPLCFFIPGCTGNVFGITAMLKNEAADDQTLFRWC